MRLSSPGFRLDWVQGRWRLDGDLSLEMLEASSRLSTLDTLGKIFMYRSCQGSIPGRRSGSPCLDYYIKRCGAPCVGYVTQEEYRESIDGVIAFLSGRYKEIERDLEARGAIEQGPRQPGRHLR